MNFSGVRNQKQETRMVIFLASAFYFLIPAEGQAMAFIMLMDPGFVSYVFFIVPLIAAAGIALLETLAFRSLYTQRKPLALFVSLFMGTAVGMSWAIIMFVLLFFMVSTPLIGGPMWLRWGAYWYFAGIHAYLLISGKRWTVRKFVKGLDLTPVKKLLWITNFLGCFVLYLYLYFDLFYMP